MLESRNPALRRAKRMGDPFGQGMDQRQVDADFEALARKAAGDRMTVEGTSTRR